MSGILALRPGSRWTSITSPKRSSMANSDSSTAYSPVDSRESTMTVQKTVAAPVMIGLVSFHFLVFGGIFSAVGINC